jgi:hypothetical protein
VLLFVETTCPKMNRHLLHCICTRKKSSRDASNVCDGIGESDDGIVDDVVVVFVSFVEGRSDDALRKEASLFFPSSGRNAKTTTDDHRCERNDDDDDGL